ncbi:uncharacterized protein SCHCODRAFT_02611974 [Schizophyllum commune H4-8]|uniref:uncharacterized protein n=1 Tax=Schizophyllum commune (strain H4-8 / FGSC 9210) TaxID=578458 RepID=UPI00215FC6CF|nr:uncharacterized protein SCHCODRAFT_02611974 [Schizophyllum commune H4-8]KAI5898403.1 hypothetical protein SCHCODRAFT_02611974 [Schizophyllum commune H4-8]
MGAIEVGPECTHLGLPFCLSPQIQHLRARLAYHRRVPTSPNVALPGQTNMRYTAVLLLAFGALAAYAAPTGLETDNINCDVIKRDANGVVARDITSCF